MSFSTCSRIAVGDLVIFYLTPLNMTPLVISEHGQFQTNYGCFKHTDLIGKPFGCIWISSNGRSKAYALRPNANLWTNVLSHRTQIIYLADASFIISALGLSPGSVIIESGTGSASFSHHLVNAVSPKGHLYTFEFHQERASLALLELQSHGIDSNIVSVVSGVDVTEKGFLPLERFCNADLPNPWSAILHSKAALSSLGGKICTFSPCVEQVQRTVNELKKQGFLNIWMAEVLMKEYQVFKIDPIILVSQPSSEIKGHTSYLTFASLLPQDSSVC